MRASASSSAPAASPFIDRFAALLEYAPGMMWMSDAAGHCVYANRRWLTFRGRTLELELGTGWADGLHPDDRSACLALSAQAIAARIPFDAEYRWLSAELEYRLIRVSGVPLPAAAGEFNGYVGSGVDVTGPRGAAHTLERTSNHLRLFASADEMIYRYRLLNSVIAHVKDGVVVESADGRVLLVNQAFCQLFELVDPPEALTGCDVRRLTCCLGPAAARFEHLRQQQQRAEPEALRLTDGRVLEIEYSPMIVDTRLITHVWQCRDISTRSQFEEELHVSRQRLRELVAHEESVREEERRGVARLLHDELGQLLTSIKLELGALAHLVRASEGLHSSGVVDRLQSVAGLLGVSIATVQRVSAKVRPATLGPLGLSEALRSEALLFEARTSIRCRVAVSPPKLQIDPERANVLYRILIEALTNVARHAAAGAVQISLKKDGNAVSLSVRDNGRGIAPEQIDNPRTMGLLGMRERALAMGGDVRITSRGRRGTLVMATLPLPDTQSSARTGGTGAVPP